MINKYGCVLRITEELLSQFVDVKCPSDWMANMMKPIILFNLGIRDVSSYDRYDCFCKKDFDTDIYKFKIRTYSDQKRYDNLPSICEGGSYPQKAWGGKWNN